MWANNTGAIRGEVFHSGTNASGLEASYYRGLEWNES